MRSVWTFFLRKSRFTFLLVGAFVAMGVFSVLGIPKESAPEVRIPVAIITTPFPGASPLDVEELVTNVIEDGLSGSLEEVSEITSTSREGVSTVVVEFDADADLDASIADVKDEVDLIKPDLPSEAEEPRVSELNFVDQPIMIVSIASELFATEFIELADEVASTLERVQGVSRVEESGLVERETQVIVRQEDLQAYDLAITDVVSAITRANAALPVGSIELDGIRYTVQFEGDISDPAEVGDIAIATRGEEVVYVRDVALVSDGVSDAATFSRVAIEGELPAQAVTLSIFKKGGGDVTSITESVRETLDELRTNILANEEVLVVIDTGEFVKQDLLSLSFTGLQTVLLVMVLLFLIIGWREALISGIAIPLSFLIGFVGLYASGNTINFVSLFSLILAVGILVDSAIVVTEGIHTKMREGRTRREAARATIEEFSWPLISGTMTTVAVFAPLFFISGVTGKFIASIPFTIIFVLLASLFVALAIIPLFASRFLKKRGVGRMELFQELITARARGWYGRRLSALLGNRSRENRFMAGAAVLLILAILLPVSGVVKTIFFPGEDADYVYIDIEKRTGSVLEETDIAVRAVEEVLLEKPYVESFATTVGTASAFTTGSAGTHLGNITVLLKEDRGLTSTEIVTDLRRATLPITYAEVNIFEQTNGPPVGAPVVVTFAGDDAEGIKEAARIGYDVLVDIPGVSQPDTSTEDAALDFVLRVDRAKAAELGIDASAVAQVLRTAVSGVEATTITKGGKDIDIVVKADLNKDFITVHDTARTTIDAITHLEIPTPRGGVLLGSIVSTGVAGSSNIIRHEDGRRIETISSEVSEGAIVSDIIATFREEIEKKELPAGVAMTIGGETEEVDQSFRDMFFALIAGMILVVAILVLQFNSFRLALYIVVIVPLSLIGILGGLAITGKTLSFPSIMGFIALSGIVVNNAIILIDVMNRLRRENPDADLRDIVVRGASLRLRPILLTAITTVVGIIPLTYASALWSPLAFAIIFGLSFAVLITLVLVPVLYHRWPHTEAH